MSDTEKMLRIAAIIGHQVGKGVEIREAVANAAKGLDIAPAAVWHSIREAQRFVEDPAIRNLIGLEL